MSIGRAFDFKKTTNPVFVMESISFRKRNFAKSMEIGLKNFRNGSYELKSRKKEQNPFFTTRFNNLTKNNSVSFKNPSNGSFNLKNQILTIEKNAKKSKKFQNFLNFVITPDKLNKRSTEKRAHKSLNYNKNQRSASITSRFLEKTQVNTSKKIWDKNQSGTLKNRKKKKTKNKSGNLKKSTSTNNYVKVKSIFGKKKKLKTRTNFNKIPYSNFFYTNQTELSMEEQENEKENNNIQQEIFEENKENSLNSGNKIKKHFFNMKQIELYKKMLKKNSKTDKISFVDFLNNPNLLKRKKVNFKTESSEKKKKLVFKPYKTYKSNEKEIKLNKPMISKKRNGSVFSYGVNSILKKNSFDLKRISIYFNKINTNIKRHKVNFSFIGLYQGVGNSACCDFFKKNLHKFVVGNPHLPSDVFKAIKSGVHRCQKLYFDSTEDDTEIKEESSCSATLIVTIDQRLFIVTIGNSSVILSLENGNIFKKVGSRQICEKPVLKSNCISSQSTRRYNVPPLDIQELRIDDAIDYAILPSEEITKIMNEEEIFRTAQSSILTSEAEKKDNHNACGAISDLILKKAVMKNFSSDYENLMNMCIFFKDVTGSQRILEEVSFDQGSMMIVTSGNKLSFKESQSAASLFKKLDLTKTISKQEKIDNATLLDGVIEERVITGNDSFGINGMI